MSKKKILSWLLVIGWMLTIFMISHVPHDASYEASKEIVSSVMGNTTANTLVFNGSMTLNKLIRKLAHVGEYYILCLFIINALRYYKLTNKQLYLHSLIISLLYACTDELHQYFVGRSANINDVLIDIIGIILGLVCYNIYLRFSKK